MLKERIRVSSCREGYVLAEDIFNCHGAIVIASGTVLSQYIINKLLDIGIEHIRINIPDEADLDSRISIFVEKYEINVISLRKAMNDLAAGKRLDKEKVNDICNSIYYNNNDFEAILGCLNMIRDCDEYTYTHSINVALYSMLIAKWLNMPENEIRNAILAGMLHDIGKCNVANDLLNKKGKLMPEEFEEIKRHTVYGYEMLKHIKEIPDEICAVTLMHHEREDASGYPQRKNRDEICLYSKIVAVADVYDAMTTDRPYKKRMTPFEAFEELKCLGVGNLNQEILNLFLKKISACYVGFKVLLNTGETGKIVYIPPMNISYPIIDTDSGLIDLSQDNTRKIIGII